VTGPCGPLEQAAEDDGPLWWWQVLSRWSGQPRIGEGRADWEARAKSLVEASMHANEAALMGLVIGPAGQLQRCRRTLDGGFRWMAEES
jgi:hypothetical protein